MSSLNDQELTPIGEAEVQDATPSAQLHGQAYWRSLDQLADTPEFRQFMHHEFPAGTSDLMDDGGRRHFLKIMAASMALAGVGLPGCRRWPQETVTPYADRPEDRIPGKPLRYATSCTLAGVASSLLATSMDGRPIKLEGNPQSGSRGSSTFAQASILDLYDPDRCPVDPAHPIIYRKRATPEEVERMSWAEFAASLQPHLERMRTTQGHQFHVLSEASASPSLAAMRRQLEQAFPRLTWHEYEPINNDEEIQGTIQAFGTPLRPQYDFAKARIIVSLDADFLFDHGNAINHMRDFAAGRRVPDSSSWTGGKGPEAVEFLQKTMSRLYCFENALSLTGSRADHRVPVRSADVAAVAAAMGAAVLGDASLQQFEQNPAMASVLEGHAREVFDHAIDDLKHANGECLVVAGRGQPAQVHALAHLMNAALGNIGSTVAYTAVAETRGHAETMRSLAAALDRNEVKTLVMLGGNPVYDAPADLKFDSLITRAEMSIHLSDYDNETSQLSIWHVNRAHYLESWGDGRCYDGQMVLQQPIIQPLYGGRSAIELLAMMSGDSVTDGYEIVRRTFAEMTGSESMWRKTLHDGVLTGSATTRQSPRPSTGIVPTLANELMTLWSTQDRGATQLVFVPDYSVYDGRYANNGWLQEVPDPLSKLTWDNAAMMSPATAAELGVDIGDLVKITAGDKSVTAAAYIMPGQADGSVVLPLGYGRGYEGRICTDAGFNFYNLRSSDAMGFATGTVQKAGGHYKLATTQDHHAIDVQNVGGKSIQKRLPTLVREATLNEYGEHPDFASHRTHVVHRLSLWNDDQLNDADYAWGMSIDLNACVGCNACIIACQAENNIPIVGKDQILRGRELHWIRLDRYFKFGKDAEGRYDTSKLEGVALQPVNCMMCENAPCEQVCPVAATVHDEDGLNVMVYNRCIGTRYCSNNCPYKVRRFNYFDYHRREPHRKQPGVLAVKSTYYTKPQAGSSPQKHLQFNPEVTVRVRGVMEKCTYCIQRIRTARIEAKNDWVKLPEGDAGRQGRAAVPDGSVQTACQETCPADAIVFGDLRDKGSRVSRMHHDERSYEMLEELNVKARTRYMAGLTNPAFGGEAHDHSHGSHSSGGHSDDHGGSH